MSNKKPPKDPFTVRKSRSKSKTIAIPSPLVESRAERIERKLRLQQQLEEIEALEQESGLSDVIDRIAELTTIIDAAKNAYRELDDLVEQLIENGGQTEFETTDGEIIELVDNFDGKNKQWKSVAFQRFSVKFKT